MSVFISSTVTSSWIFLVFSSWPSNTLVADFTVVSNPNFRFVNVIIYTIMSQSLCRCFCNSWIPESVFCWSCSLIKGWLTCYKTNGPFIWDRQCQKLLDGLTITWPSFGCSDNRTFIIVIEIPLLQWWLAYMYLTHALSSWWKTTHWPWIKQSNKEVYDDPFDFLNDLIIMYIWHFIQSIFNICVRVDMAFIEPMHRNKPNITYLHST